MTRQQRDLINRINENPNFDIENLIGRTLFLVNEQQVDFTARAFVSYTYNLYGRISKERNRVLLTTEQSILNTPEHRYTYALLLAVYTEVMQEYSSRDGTAYITSDWDVISDDLEIQGRPIQTILKRTARDILINDYLFEDDSERRLPTRRPSERYGVPVYIIREKFDDIDF